MSHQDEDQAVYSDNSDQEHKIDSFMSNQRRSRQIDPDEIHTEAHSEQPQESGIENAALNKEQPYQEFSKMQTHLESGEIDLSSAQNNASHYEILKEQTISDINPSREYENHQEEHNFERKEPEEAGQSSKIPTENLHQHQTSHQEKHHESHEIQTDHHHNVQSLREETSQLTKINVNTGDAQHSPNQSYGESHHEQHHQAQKMHDHQHIQHNQHSQNVVQHETQTHQNKQNNDQNDKPIYQVERQNEHHQNHHQQVQRQARQQENYQLAHKTHDENLHQIENKDHVSHPHQTHQHHHQEISRQHQENEYEREVQQHHHQPHHPQHHQNPISSMTDQQHHFVQETAHQTYKQEERHQNNHQQIHHEENRVSQDHQAQQQKHEVAQVSHQPDEKKEEERHEIKDKKQANHQISAQIASQKIQIQEREIQIPQHTDNAHHIEENQHHSNTVQVHHQKKQVIKIEEPVIREPEQPASPPSTNHPLSQQQKTTNNQPISLSRQQEQVPLKKSLERPLDEKPPAPTGTKIPVATTINVNNARKEKQSGPKPKSCECIIM